MQIAHHVSHFTFTARSGGRARRREMSRVASTTVTQLAKRAGGPQDRAFYHCGCGMAFTATVTTTVGCPHCGTEQAW
jgi:hypothetical protein